ncbi:carboxypeptidase, partial [Bacillus cereus]|nr:carboxypeptidase [Bacillus cereus]
MSGNSSNTWWRKNRNPNHTNGGNYLGVDINRNFDFLWNSGIGTSDNPAVIIYKGTAPFSEPETR